MTVTPPIHSTALLPIEFIPDAQDWEKYRRTNLASLRAREQAADRMVTEINEKTGIGGIDQEEAEKRLAAVDVMRDQIREEYGFVDAEAARMKARYPKPQKFLIAVPTTVEREQINSRLVSLGLKQITQEMIRATMIEELYQQDWSLPDEGAISYELNQQRAEDNANFLDSVWLRQQAHDEATRRWSEQEIERTLDTENGAPERPRAPMPPKIIGIREQARMQLLIDRMMTESQRLRDLAAANMDFGRRNALLMARMHVVGVENFDPPIEIERGRHTRAMSEDTVLLLRQAVDDISWQQLINYIDRLYQIDGGEEKNSDSPPGKPSLPGGSTEPNESPESNGGSSTNSSSEPAPGDASATIIDKSSDSISDSGTAPALRVVSDTPTDDRY
jgi:hypothetical protein